MLTVCYINRQPGKGYHYSNTNACGESAASKKRALSNDTKYDRACKLVTELKDHAKNYPNAHS